MEPDGRHWSPQGWHSFHSLGDKIELNGRTIEFLTFPFPDGSQLVPVVHSPESELIELEAYPIPTKGSLCRFVDDEGDWFGCGKSFFPQPLFFERVKSRQLTGFRLQGSDFRMLRQMTNDK